jgi:hypothetical protein
MTIKTHIVLVAALLLSVALSGSILAEQAWICCIAQGIACQDDGSTGPPDLGGRERPTFLRVDVAKKQVTLLAPAERKGEVTKIDNVTKGDGIWIFSGIEEKRAWSMVISDKGSMTLSVTTDGASWAVFGYAMPEN